MAPSSRPAASSPWTPTSAAGSGWDTTDAARVFLPDGVTLIDGTSWILHAADTTYGRCPDGTGAFFTGVAVTKGAANACLSPVPQPWPGSASVTTVDAADVLGADVSGLDYEGTGTSDPGRALGRRQRQQPPATGCCGTAAQWVRDTANGWSAGKTLRFPGRRRRWPTPRASR